MFKLLANKNKKYFLLGFGLLILFSLDRPILARLIIYNVDLAKGKLDFSFIRLFLPNLLYLGFYFFANFYSELFLDKFMVKSRHFLNCNIYKKLIKNHTNFSKAEISTIFTNDIQIICDEYISGLISIIYLLISFIASAMLIFSINEKILLYLLIISIVTLYLQREIAKAMQEQQIIFNKKITNIVSTINETFSSINQIRVYRLEEKFNKKFKIKSREATDRLYNLSISEDLVEVVNQFSATLIEVGLYVLGVILIKQGEVSIQQLLGLVVTTSTIIHPIYSFSRTSAKFSKTKKVREKIMNIISLDNVSIKEKDKIEKIKNLKIKNYQGKYEDKLINKKLNFNVNKGEKILIQGENGAGKSTMISNILGFNKKYDGEILYNDLDINKINIESIWEKISYVSQKTLIFEDDLKNNIILEEKYDRDKYLNLIKILGLDKLDEKNIINDLQDNLSGGEIQKILIGRAMYKNSDFLIMDEPFSALDKESKNKLVYQISKDERGVIVIAHNLENDIIEKFDKLVFIDKI